LPNPTVSIVIPCYNAHRYLARALESIRAQTFRDVEIVVVDDGSTDMETQASLAGIESEVHMVRQANKGLPGARNAGIRAAKGDYVVPLDCDDWIDPAFLAKTVACLEQHPEAAYAFTYMALEGEKGGVMAKGFNAFEQLFLNQLPYCLVMRKSVWESLGGYDETMREGYEDWEFNIRAARRGYYGAVIREPLFHYWMAASGMLQSVSRKRHGRLWSAIQMRNRDAYRMGFLFHTWRAWRRRPSSWNLWLLPGLLALHRVLPAAAFESVFARLLKLGASERVQGRNAVTRTT
jgi:GT2 family glycosyltransferase